MHDIILKKEIDWTASWLQDPIMKGQAQVQPLDAKRIRSFRTEKHNIHTLFRKTFTLQDKPIKKAILYVTADDSYKAYVNGSFIAYGPAQSFAFSYNYNAFNITKLLTAGENILAFHVFYQGMLNMSLVSADNLNGMICMLDIEYVDKEKVRIQSDKSFKCFNLKAYSFDKVYGYETQFAENIDLNEYPYNWEQLDFDDALWEQPFIPAIPYPAAYTFKAQNTPTVYFEKTYPKTIQYKEKGRYLLDFGSEIAGNTVIHAKGEKGHIIRVWHAEELTEDKTQARHNMRCGCDYDESITLSGKEDRAEFYDYKGFRYIEVIDYPGRLAKKDIYVIQRHYPIPKNHAQLTLDSKLFNDIWAMCEKGIVVGTQEAYLDCPTREKGAFLGDGLITGLSHLFYTGDIRIMKKFLLDCISSARVCPSLFTTVITYDASQFIDYSLILPLVLYEYYKHSKDVQMLEQALPALEGIISYYSNFYEQSGILGAIKHVYREAPSVLVDWPVLYRDGYNEKYLSGCNSFASITYSGILKSTAKIYDILNNKDRSGQLCSQAKLLDDAVIKEFYDADKDLFVISKDNPYHNYHTAVFSLYFDMQLPKGPKTAMQHIKERGIICGVYFTYYLFCVLWENQDYDLIYELMTKDTRNSWKGMLETGATTCIEAWHPDDKINCSWCHPWSSTPMIFMDKFLGVYPHKAGYEVLGFSPRIPSQLSKGTYTKPTPLSDITVEFERIGNKIHYALTLKKECTLHVSLKDGESFEMQAGAGTHEFTLDE